MKQKVLLKRLCFKFGCILETNKNVTLARTHNSIIQVHPDVYGLGLVGLFVVLHEIGHNVYSHVESTLENEQEADEFAYEFLCINFSDVLAQKAVTSFLETYSNVMSHERCEFLREMVV